MLFIAIVFSIIVNTSTLLYNKMQQEESMTNDLEDELVFNCASFAVNYSGISNIIRINHVP